MWHSLSYRGSDLVAVSHQLNITAHDVICQYVRHVFLLWMEEADAGCMAEVTFTQESRLHVGQSC